MIIMRLNKESESGKVSLLMLKGGGDETSKHVVPPRYIFQLSSSRNKLVVVNHNLCREGLQWKEEEKKK